MAEVRVHPQAPTPPEGLSPRASRFEPIAASFRKAQPDGPDPLIPLEQAVVNAYRSFLPNLEVHASQEHPLEPLGPDTVGIAMKKLPEDTPVEWRRRETQMAQWANSVSNDPSLWDQIDAGIERIRNMALVLYRKANPDATPELNDQTLMALILSLRSNVQSYFFDAQSENDMKRVIDTSPVATAIMAALPENFPLPTPAQ